MAWSVLLYSLIRFGYPWRGFGSHFWTGALATREGPATFRPCVYSATPRCCCTGKYSTFLFFDTLCLSVLLACARVIDSRPVIDPCLPSNICANLCKNNDPSFLVLSPVFCQRCLEAILWPPRAMCITLCITWLVIHRRLRLSTEGPT